VAGGVVNLGRPPPPLLAENNRGGCLAQNPRPGLTASTLHPAPLVCRPGFSGFSVLVSWRSKENSPRHSCCPSRRTCQKKSSDRERGRPPSALAERKAGKKGEAPSRVQGVVGGLESGAASDTGSGWVASEERRQREAQQGRGIRGVGGRRRQFRDDRKPRHGWVARTPRPSETHWGKGVRASNTPCATTFKRTKNCHTWE
jgi:hypothetical protein